jgi:hypothetical protein
MPNSKTRISSAKFAGLLLSRKVITGVLVCKCLDSNVNIGSSRQLCTNSRSPISTYSRKGCTGPGKVKWQHSIIYSDKQEPKPLAGEVPGPGELGMLSPVSVKPRDPRDKIHPCSRINYAKVYTVEHSVKVYDFGDVRSNYVSTLEEQWKYVLNLDSKGKAKAGQSAPLNPIVENVESVQEEEVPEPSILPVHGTAIYAWIPAAGADGQLAIQKDDRIFVWEYVDGSWGRGRNERTRQEGTFPSSYVRVDYGDYAIALQDYSPKKDGHLKFKEDDRIVEIEYVSPALDKGKNKRTGKKGRYPYEYVDMNRGDFGIASYDYEEDEGKPDQLVFDAGDRILVTEQGGAQEWAWGRNERTRMEGKFPPSYVQME